MRIDRLGRRCKPVAMIILQTLMIIIVSAAFFAGMVEREDNEK
jgi:hypothetical protein